MKRFSTFIIFITILSNYSDAQLLGVNQPLFSDLPFFNTEFIKVNRIKSITGSISSKKVEDIIREKGINTHYTFNEDGRLNMQLSSIKSQKKKDTSITFYEYNKLGEIQLKRKSDGDGFYSYKYQFNANKQIVAQTYSRDINLKKAKIEFKLKKEYIIKTDSFSYESYGAEQTKKIFYNSYGIKFKEQINSFDKLGYLIVEYSKFIIGNNKQKLSYEYEQYGRLYKKHTFTNISQGKKNTEIYSYDEIGNVIEIKYYKNEQHTSTKQFLYANKTMLLSAILIQEISTNFLTIIKYDYTFFDGSTNYTNVNRLNITDTN
jgi:hypothetical protein